MSVAFLPVWAEDEMVPSEDLSAEYPVEMALSESNYTMVGDKKVLNIGFGTSTVYTDGDLVVGNQLNDDGSVKVQGNCDMVGAVENGVFIDYDTINDAHTTKYTNNLKIGTKGGILGIGAKKNNLTIYGEGRVVLGGQNGSNYQKITADKVLVDGDEGVTNLQASNADINTLEIHGGRVELHAGGNFRSGNDVLGGSAKRTEIKKIIMKGGSLLLGSEGTVMGAKHYLTKLNGSIEQSGDSSIKVAGWALAQSGLKIVQTEGVMTFRDRLDITGSATNNIWQGYAYDENGDLKSTTDTKGTITFGDLGKGTYAINQSNAGTIQIDKVQGEASLSINQEGKGNIVFGSGFDNATVNVSKSTGTLEFKSNINLSSLTKDGGAIKVAEGATLKADSLNWNLVEKQTKDAGSDIEISGSVSLSSGEIKNVTSENGAVFVTNTGTLTADTVNVNAGSLKMDGNGSLSANSISANNGNVSINTNVSLSNGAISIDGDTVTNTGNLSAGQIVVNGGTFINEGNINYTAPSALLALGSDEDNALLLLSGTTDASDVVVKGGDFVNIGNVGSVLVEEGGTLTMEGQSSATSIVMDGGRINVTGESTVGSLTLNGENNVINFDFSNVETAPSIVLNSGEALDLSSTTIMVTVSTEMLENLAGQNFDLFGGNVENITNATFVFTDGDADTSNDKTADVALGSTSGSIKVENIQSVPEPTTATLSLLALAGVAMRRRRK